MQQQSLTHSVATLDEAVATITTILTEELDIFSIPCCSWSLNSLRVLTQIARQPSSHADLREQLEMHRTTLRRKLTQFEERQWIDAVPAENSYQLTTTGHIVVTGIAELLSKLQTATRLEAVQASLPVAVPFAPPDLDRCEITQRHQHDPYAPTSAFLDLVRSTDRFRGALPTLNQHHLDAFIANVTAGDHVECLSVAPAFELLRTNCSAAFTTLHEAPTAQLFVCEEGQPFGVCRCDETVVILGYDENMTIDTLVTAPASCRSVVEWVIDHYKSRKQAAVPYD
jgi:predicted transcriptional regulator